MTLFRDRRAAGRALGEALGRTLGRTLADQLHPDVLVMGLPRGGVPVAFEVAVALHAPLDVLVVRKLGVPRHEELAMGAIAPGGVRVLLPEVMQAEDITPAELDAVTTVERAELVRRELAYRSGAPSPALQGKTVILVDDGVATGASMRAALRAVRASGPARIVVAAPVMSREAYAELAREADACETLGVPEPFYGVGMHYDDFTQTSDAEVTAFLGSARRMARDGAVGQASSPRH